MMHFRALAFISGRRLVKKEAHVPMQSERLGFTSLYVAAMLAVDIS